MDGHSSTIRSVSFDPTSTLSATGADDQTVRLWPLDDPSAPRAIGGSVAPGGTVRCRVAFSSTGITILGTGMMAEALGGRWVPAGHRVTVAGRAPDRTAELAARPGATAQAPCEAVAGAEAVLAAVPFDAVAATLTAAGAADGVMGRRDPPRPGQRTRTRHRCAHPPARRLGRTADRRTRPPAHTW